jgi:hypothetical protein
MSVFRMSLLVAALMALGASSVALAAGGGAQFSVMGEVNLSKYTVSALGQSESTDAKVGYGGGLGVEFPVGKAIGLEIDALYQMRKIGESGSSDTLTFTYLNFPVGLRFHFGKNFSLIAGGYYASAMGKIKDQDGNEGEYAANGLKTSDYGAFGGLGVNFGAKTQFFFDARYYMGLANQLTDDFGGVASFKWSGFQGLVGLRFGG